MGAMRRRRVPIRYPLTGGCEIQSVRDANFLNSTGRTSMFRNVELKRPPSMTIANVVAAA
jgi:hypothetical protein